VWVIVVVILVFMAVPITGIIAAIAVPNLLSAIQRGKQKRTMADIRTICVAIDAYAVDNNTYPPYGASLDEVASLVEPTYIRTLPRTDGWEREIRYHCLEPNGDFCTRYALQSAGKDGLYDDLGYEIEREETNNFDCDILWANGSFVWYPEGVQRGGR
jgi:general secretion pathway protein G